MLYTSKVYFPLIISLSYLIIFTVHRNQCKEQAPSLINLRYFLLIASIIFILSTSKSFLYLIVNSFSIRVSCASNLLLLPCEYLFPRGWRERALAMVRAFVGHVCFESFEKISVYRDFLWINAVYSSKYFYFLFSIMHIYHHDFRLM